MARPSQPAELCIQCITVIDPAILLQQPMQQKMAAMTDTLLTPLTYDTNSAHPQPSAPQQRLPVGSWDCHCHVFGPYAQFPLAKTRSYTPPPAPFARLHALHHSLGVSHAVLVQPACHGQDHSAMLAAIEASSHQYRGIALIGPQTPEAELQRLHNGGVRGARLNFVPHLGGAPSLADFEAIVAKLQAQQWHLCMHIDGTSLREWLPQLRKLPVPFVIDHMARLNAQHPDGLNQLDMQVLHEVLQLPNAWLKISAADRIAQGQPPYASSLPYLQQLIATRPERLLWGSDWPHPNVRGDAPDDGQLVDLFYQACPDAALQRQILITNPQQLYAH